VKLVDNDLQGTLASTWLIMPRFSVVDSSIHFMLVFNVADMLINSSLINPLAEGLSTCIQCEVNTKCK